MNEYQIFIEEYKGFTITFHRDDVLFSCGHKTYDDAEFTSTSYKSIKKYIDTWHKNNVTFEPVRVAKLTGYGDIGTYKFMTVIGIRKDGNFTIKDEDGKIQQLSSYDEKVCEVASAAHEAYNDEVEIWKNLTSEFLEKRRIALETARTELGLSETPTGINHLRENFEWHE